MDNDKVEFQEVLKRFSLWGGIILAIISIYFSYDGLDQTINGGNPNYTEIANYIGIVMAVMVTLIQFVFNTDFNHLSLTLKVVGAASYIYSMYTNYLGINHLFGFHGITGVMIAVFMDVTPEALISWSLEDVTNGDLIGNMGKLVLGNGKRSKKMEKREPAFRSEQNQPKPAFPVQNQPKRGQGRGFQESHRVERGNYKSSDKPNPFGKFGE